MTRYVVAIVGLTLAYALALGSFHPLDLLFGAGLSAALVFVSRRFVFEAGLAGGLPFCGVWRPSSPSPSRSFGR
jgi:multisubunit Na+/H+ antiporter MnhE subunit